MNSKNDIKVNKHLCRMFSELRKEYGYTQEEIAQLLGLSRISVVNIESGKQKVSASMVYILSCLYNRPVNYFYPELIAVSVSYKTKKVRVVKVKEVLKPVKI